jgi:hypothetical protein
MPAAYQDLYIEQGATFSLNLSVDDLNGANFGLTNGIAISRIKKSYGSNAVASFVTTVDATSSRIGLNMSAANTANITPGKYVYDTILSLPPAQA